MHGTLYIVATPIGNLEDITLRALRVLKEVDVIFAEDTRVTKKLLSHFAIATRIESLNAHSEEKKSSLILSLLEEGKSVAYVSDAGTPGISDPGARLVGAVHDTSFKAVPIPGPSALATALSVSGITDSDFTFLGFLPHKKGRQTLFKEIGETKRTTIFYESPHRILKTLESLAEYAGEKKVIIARELTKMYEEVLEGTAIELLNVLTEIPEKKKGEFVVIVSR